ncbi:MAG: putative rane protein [Chlamydiales bacterium]|jgi:uncharacterized paraquat-inducible protein A|nr:putative rane protein [Chlamydiales bacterium]
MIPISLAAAFLIYLGGTLVFIFTFWLYNHYYHTKNRIMPLPQQLFVCEYCQITYLDDPIKKTTRCPTCSSFNKNNRYEVKKQG